MIGPPRLNPKSLKRSDGRATWLRLLKIVVRVQLVVPKELKDASKKLVLATSRNDVDRCARVAAKLGREVRRLDVDLTDEIDTDIVDLAGIASGIEIGAAIDTSRLFDMPRFPLIGWLVLRLVVRSKLIVSRGAAHLESAS